MTVEALDWLLQEAHPALARPCRHSSRAIALPAGLDVAGLFVGAESEAGANRERFVWEGFPLLELRDGSAVTFWSDDGARLAREMRYLHFHLVLEESRVEAQGASRSTVLDFTDRRSSRLSARGFARRAVVRCPVALGRPGR